MSGHVVILTTAGTEQEASDLARELVNRRLAACVNVIPQVRSIFRWQNEVHDDREWLLLIKTRRDRFEAVRAAIRELHSYDLPETVLLDVDRGDEAYLRWIDDSLDGSGPEAT